jgi:quercetin dioxygenase-like cupin family protein
MAKKDSTYQQAELAKAEVILSCIELTENLEFFTNELAFKIETIFPADNPKVTVLIGYGLRLRLQVGVNDNPGQLRIERFGQGNQSIIAPNGTKIEFVDICLPVPLPANQPILVVNRIASENAWQVGRAGMRYRDLIPERQGGRFIASHIHIPNGGPVPDYVHYHKIRFQLIYCYKGWAKLVYQDQGEPFYLKAGDCVLQPPQIRHRVLESSEGLEVVEVGCPAEHETYAEHEMTLPNAIVDTGKEYFAQQFVHHIAQESAREPWRIKGFHARNLGIGKATLGIVGAYVVSPIIDILRESAEPTLLKHDEEFLFLFILKGGLEFFIDGQETLNLKEGDSVTIPAGLFHGILSCSNDAEFLEVRLSDDFSSIKIKHQ